MAILNRSLSDLFHTRLLFFKRRDDADGALETVIQSFFNIIGNRFDFVQIGIGTGLALRLDGNKLQDFTDGLVRMRLTVSSICASL